ncbi:hypothetical protein G6L28_16540 [Agrobacterium larrymoorei]|uniref:hypothetical protein n=1 Tax=Agrobacterium larrymoorei TaxID=160699 RepID=UPI0015716995|nr:hypothetical protein [Agrobacterium larrymoorei]NTJ44209.1 hypothetical protein [Agrobacterium larrymoorei]
MSKDTKARDAIEERDEKTSKPADLPAAGPHAKSHLTDKSKTPGAGSLPEGREDDVSPGSG